MDYYETFRLLIQGMVCITTILIIYCGAYLANIYIIEKSMKIDLDNYKNHIKFLSECKDRAEKEISEARQNNLDTEIESCKTRIIAEIIEDYDPCRDNNFIEEMYLKAVRLCTISTYNMKRYTAFKDSNFKCLYNLWDYLFRQSVVGYATSMDVVISYCIMKM